MAAAHTHARARARVCVCVCVCVCVHRSTDVVYVLPNSVLLLLRSLVYLYQRTTSPLLLRIESTVNGAEFRPPVIHGLTPLTEWAQHSAHSISACADYIVTYYEAHRVRELRKLWPYKLEEIESNLSQINAQTHTQWLYSVGGEILYVWHSSRRVG